MGMAADWGLQESVTGCRPAGRGINLNGIAPLLLFLVLLLLRPFFFSSSALSGSFCASPPVLGLAVLQKKALQKERMLGGSKEYSFALNGAFAALYTFERLLCFRKTSGVVAHISEVACWRLSHSDIGFSTLFNTVSGIFFNLDHIFPCFYV